MAIRATGEGRGVSAPGSEGGDAPEAANSRIPATSAASWETTPQRISIVVHDEEGDPDRLATAIDQAHAELLALAKTHTAVQPPT